MVDKHSHIELYEPKTEGDWSDFSKAVAAQINRLKFGESTMDVVEFMSIFLQRACDRLDGDDLQKLNNGLVVLVNDALLAQRKEQGKKTNKTHKYAKCNIDGDDDDYYYQEEYVSSKPSEVAPAPPADDEDQPASTPKAEAEEVDAEEYFRQRNSAKGPTAKPQGGGSKKGSKKEADQKALQALLAAKLGGAAKPKPAPSAAASAQAEKERKEKEELKRRMLAQQQEVEEEEEEESSAPPAEENPNARFKKKVAF